MSDLRLFLFDELFLVFDLSVRVEVVNVLDKIKWEKGVMMIIMIYDINLFFEIGDFVMFINRRLIVFGRFEEVFIDEVIKFVYGLMVKVILVGGKVYCIIGDFYIYCGGEKI